MRGHAADICRALVLVVEKLHVGRARGARHREVAAAPRRAREERLIEAVRGASGGGGAAGASAEKRVYAEAVLLPRGNIAFPFVSVSEKRIAVGILRAVRGARSGEVACERAVAVRGAVVVGRGGDYFYRNVAAVDHADVVVVEPAGRQSELGQRCRGEACLRAVEREIAVGIEAAARVAAVGDNIIILVYGHRLRVACVRRIEIAACPAPEPAREIVGDGYRGCRALGHLPAAEGRDACAADGDGSYARRGPRADVYSFGAVVVDRDRGVLSGSLVAACRGHYNHEKSE